MGETKTAPCWVLTNADGTDLDDFENGNPHYPSEAVAAENAAHLADGGYKPRRLDHLCVTVACSCCEVVYDEEEDGVAHFDSREEAEKMLANFWDFTNGVVKCEYCKVGPCDAERGDHG